MTEKLVKDLINAKSKTEVTTWTKDGDRSLGLAKPQINLSNPVLDQMLIMHLDRQVSLDT